MMVIRSDPWKNWCTWLQAMRNKMADIFTSRSPETGAKEGFTKYPMRRLELSLKKFIRVLSTDLERLKKHTLNISRLTKFEDWAGLHKEQVNANRTVQQINSNINEIEKTRRQVIDEDLMDFDLHVDPVKKEAVEAMGKLIAFIGQGPSYRENQGLIETGTGDVDLGQMLSSQMGKAKGPLFEGFAASNSAELHHQPSPAPSSSERMMWSEDSKAKSRNSTEMNGGAHSSRNIINPSSNAGGRNLDITDSSYAEDIVPAPEHMSLLTTKLHVAPQNSDATASWEELQESLLDLNSLVHKFASAVEEQGESVDVIEDHIDHAQVDVAEGTANLAKASRYKAMMFPVVGAVVGGVVGGPIGLLAGMKIGGVAGLVGGAVGLVGGRALKKRQEKIVNIEMSNMTEKRSQSMPESFDEAAEDNSDQANSTLTQDSSKSFSLGQLNVGKYFSFFSSSSSTTSSSEKQ